MGPLLSTNEHEEEEEDEDIGGEYALAGNRNKETLTIELSNRPSKKELEDKTSCNGDM